MQALISQLGGVAGFGAALGFVIKLLVDRRTRLAQVEYTELTADEIRVKMADNISHNLQVQLDNTRKDLHEAFERLKSAEARITELEDKLRSKNSQLNLMEEQQELDRRKIYILERAVIDGGGELPYEVFNES